MNNQNLTVLGTETADILTQHIKVVESAHPNVDKCSLSIKNKGTRFIAKIRGQFKKETISGEATDKAPMKAYINAHKEFCSNIERIRVREKVEEAMSDFSLVY